MIEIRDGIVRLGDSSSARDLRVEMRIESGSFVCLIGHNGSGKSTLLDVIAGVRSLEKGCLCLKQPTLPISYAVQDSNAGLLPWLRIRDNITLPSRLARNGFPHVEDRANDLLDLFGLVKRAQAFPYQLSGGEKQIVNLTRALCTPAVTVLLDEPFAALHHRRRTQARRVVSEYCEGKTCIVVTHSLDDLELPFTAHLAIQDDSVTIISSTRAKEILASDF